MQIPILIEPKEGGGFRARCALYDLTIEDSSRDEALARMERVIMERRKAGAEWYMLQVGPPQKLSDLAGSHNPDDPVIEEWKQAVEDYRREVDSGPDFPWLEQSSPA